MRVGIVGAGRVAEHHLRFLRRTPGVEIVGLADARLENAQRLAVQHRVPYVTVSLEELLSQKLDLLHVLTPPQYHAAQALAAIQRGVHVLVEKPVALSPHEAEDIYREAAKHGVIACPDFIHLFHPRMQEAIATVAAGRLGRVLHCECVLGVDLRMPELQEAMGLHWSYLLPGGVLQNYVSHPLYLVLYWVGPARRIQVTPHSFGSLPQGVTDHLVITIQGDCATAQVVVSLAASLAPFTLQVYGDRGSLSVDFVTLSTVVNVAGGLPPSVERLASNIGRAGQLVRSTARNVYEYARGRLLPYHGLAVLIPELVSSIRSGGPAPVSVDLALAVSRAESEVLAQAGKVHLDTRPRPGRTPTSSAQPRVLVTGASGYLGRHVVTRLVAAGHPVRALVRPLSHVDELERLGVEIRFGDLRDGPAVSDAVAGVEIVVHLGAALRGTAEYMRASTVSGTANVAAAAERNGVRRVVYVSSLAVYDYTRLTRAKAVTAEADLEQRPEARGGASAAKREAEDVALGALSRARPEWTILRPSLIFGGGRDLTATVGVRVSGRIIHLGRPRSRLRLVHVADVAEAVLLAATRPEAAGRVYNVSHPDTLTAREFWRIVRGRQPLYLPLWVAWGAVLVLRVWLRVLGRRLNFGRRRIAYLYRDVLVDTSPIRAELGWGPAGGLGEQVASEACRAATGAAR